jgi:hypothetical protein
VLTGIGTPTAWPFFKHGVANPITRNALGQVVGNFESTLELNANLLAGQTLLVGTLSRDMAAGDTVIVDIDGNVLAQDIFQLDVPLVLTMNSWKTPAAIIGGLISVNFSNVPEWSVMLAITLTTAAGLLKETAIALFPATQDPNSGATFGYLGAPCFHWGLIGTDGWAGDLLGTWQGSMTAGQRASNGVAGVDLKEGYRIPLLPTGARAWIINQTNRHSIATVAYYQ